MGTDGVGEKNDKGGEGNNSDNKDRNGNLLPLGMKSSNNGDLIYNNADAEQRNWDFAKWVDLENGDGYYKFEKFEFDDIDPKNQDSRNPTEIIDMIYEYSGGDKLYFKNYSKFLQGEYMEDAIVKGLVQSDNGVFVSDSYGAEEHNTWVNKNGVFYAGEYDNYSNDELVNFLMGSFVYGSGPTNIVFPLNGSVSNSFKDSFVFYEALEKWYNQNRGGEKLINGNYQVDGNKGNVMSILENGFINTETLIGSVSIEIRVLNEQELLINIFNVTSLTSGDLEKHMPYAEYPLSIVREDNALSPTDFNPYSNISQTYSFTIPIDRSKLINDQKR